MPIRSAILIASMLAVRCALAADLAVGSEIDAVDAVPGDGTCATLAGVCTLRAAVQEANALPGADTISVGVGTFTLSLAGAEPDVDPAAAGDLDLTDVVTIVGAGPSATAVVAGGIGRAFEVTASVTLSRLSVRDGDEVFGGGLLVVAPDETAVALVVEDAQLVANRATHGGALYVDGGASVTLERVSVTDNVATTSGAALENAFGTVTFRNATVSANTSGLHDVVNGAVLVLEHVTLADATIGGNNDIAAGMTTIARSVLDDGAGAIVCAEGTFVSGGGNVEHGTSCGFAEPGDVGGANPALGPLEDNVAGTRTRAVPATSPAVDAAGACTTVEDQRGTPRPLDGDGDGTALCDAGAYELDPAAPPTTSTTTTTLPGACPVAATFDGVRCGIDALAGRLDAEAAAGVFRDRLVASLENARARVGAAEGGRSKPARKLLRKAASLVKKAGVKIGSRKGRAAIVDAGVRTALQADAAALRSAIVALSGSLG